MFPGRDRTWHLNKFSERAWPGSRDPLNLWALNADISSTVKATDFKFDVRVSRDSPDTFPYLFPKVAWPGHMTP